MNNPSRNILLRRLAIVAAGTVAAVGVFAAVSGAPAAGHSIALKVDDSAVNRGALESASYAKVVKRVAPSIVEVVVQMKPRRAAMDQEGGDMSPFFNDPNLRQFFGNHMQRVPEAPESGLGSGVIISADGYIVTNNHVVDGAKEVNVTLSDGRQFTAHVVGRDPQTDIAVIKVHASDLPAVTFAASHDVEVGDRVLAIGNPFGIGETVTTGIVSATGRRAGLGLAYENFIQTDAAINPGNSGGALIDVEGRLVGINTAILSHSGGFQGVGLAIPSDMVSNVAENLVAHGKVVRGYIGVGVQNMTPGLAESFGIKASGGALITDVQPDSPASQAGLRSGDVITAVNGKAVDTSTGLSLDVGETAPGSHLTLDLLRDGRPEHLSVTTRSKPSGDGQSGNELAPADDQGVLNGVAVSDIDANARRDLNLPERLSGAVITGVEPTSASARAGLKEGDVILEIDRHPVTSAQGAVDLSAKAASRRTLVKLWSHGTTLYVVVDETPSPADGAN